MGSKVECSVVFHPRKNDDKAVQVAILIDPTDEQITKTLNYAMGNKIGIVSETHRVGSWGCIEPEEGGIFIFVFSYECQPQEPKVLTAGTCVEYEERFDARICKLQARKVSVRANPCASADFFYFEDTDPRDDNQSNRQRV